MSIISPAEVYHTRSSGQPCLCLDVRTPTEHRELHAEGVTLLPLDQLNVERVRKLRTDDRPIYLFCRSGSRATQAHDQLKKSGLNDCFIVEGGTEAWAANGFPVVRGRKAMSLERQVRIAAGLLVVIGIILAQTLHPYAIGLSAFVGVGLIFAGLTDWCGMGLLLARMPWNQVGATCCKTS